MTKQTIKTKQQAREWAISIQTQISQEALSWGEIHEIQDELRKIGKRFGLIKEFKENGLL